MKLDKYNEKRDFGLTPEPPGKVGPKHGGGLSYVIQKHAASRLHYDFRLELDGVLLSWAVPKGPSLDPADKRLAMQTEDHPMEYGDFEGVIPKGQYGGGTVLLWDRGTWEPIGDPVAAYAKGHLKFKLNGEKLQGEWNLFQLRGSNKYGKDEGKAWMLVKVDDADARRGESIVEVAPNSVKSNRSIADIASDKDRVWQSNRSVAENVKSGAVEPPPKAKRIAKAAKNVAADPVARGKVKGAAKASPAAAAKVASVKPADLAAVPGAKKAVMPRQMMPMLTTLVDTAPSGDDWVHEIKHDGYRMIARVDNGAVEITSRNGKVWTTALGALPKALAGLPVQTAWLDGEVVVMNADGRSSFNALQNALGARDPQLAYIIFDVMYLDGIDLRGVALVDRKAVLQQLLAKVDPQGPLRFGPEIRGGGPEFFRQACALGLEGAISKRADSPYRDGVRNREWVKIKCQQRQEMVIGGYTDPQGSRNGFGALLLGVYDNGQLRYAGKVGTGFNSQTLDSIYKLLKPREQDKPAFVNPPRGYEAKGAHWVKPDLVAEVRFAEWSPEGALRHPSFQGLRQDKRATDVKREIPAASPSAGDANDDGDQGNGGTAQRAASKTAASKATASKATASKATASKATASKATASKAKASKAVPSNSAVLTAAGRAASVSKAPGSSGKDAAPSIAGVLLSNPDKLYFPEAGLSKRDIVQYYADVADWILPQIRNRPLSLVRCPDGWQGQCFYQKNADKAVNAAVSRVEVPESKGTAIYMAANSVAALAGLVQWGCIEFHPWGSRTPKLDKPDQLIFDFDPDDGLQWATLVEAATLLHTLLDDLGLRGFLKTTGGKGLHVVVPIRPTLDWEVAKGFTKAIADVMTRTFPDRFTSVMSKERRKGRIFVDYLRNGQGATAIAPYAVRARKGAPVSAPIHWEELERDVRFEHFNVTNMRERLQSLKKDPWADFLTLKQTITRAMFRRVDFSGN